MLNIQQVREVALEVSDLSEMSLTAGRSANLVDSRVALGSWAKGRSSARFLNQALRASVGDQLVGKKQVCNLWGASAENPSDDPSRDVSLREPTEVPSFVPEPWLYPAVPGIADLVRSLRKRGASRPGPG